MPARSAPPRANIYGSTDGGASLAMPALKMPRFCAALQNRMISGP
jgi:hypothetical protein